MNEVSTEYIAIGSVVFSAGIAWGISKWRQDRSERDTDSMWKVITKLRDWQVEHEKDSAEKRVEFERRVGELSTATARNQAQYQEMQRRLDSMDAKLDRLLESKK